MSPACPEAADEALDHWQPSQEGLSIEINTGWGGVCVHLQMNKKGSLSLALCQSSWDDLAYPKMHMVNNTTHIIANAFQTQDIAFALLRL